jgi:hypothetical protein
MLDRTVSCHSTCGISPSGIEQNNITNVRPLMFVLTKQPTYYVVQILVRATAIYVHLRNIRGQV